MAVLVRGKLSEGTDDVVLPDPAVELVIIHAHHELEVVNDDMLDVVDVHTLGHHLTHKLGYMWVIT